MIDVAHHGHHRCARLGRTLDDALRLEQAFGLVLAHQLDGMTEFLDDQRCRFLVERLIDGRHDPELHQLADYGRRLDRHLLGQLSDGYRFGYRYFVYHFVRRQLEAVFEMFGMIGS